MCPCKYSFVGGVFLPFDSKNGPQAELMETFKRTNISAAKDPGRAGKDSSTLDSHTDLCTIQKLEDMLAPCFSMAIVWVSGKNGVASFDTN